LALNVTAVKATHRFTWGRAIASSLGLLIFACVAAVAVIAVLTLVGNAVQDVFSNITQELNAPR
jgi:integral membrane sensor domain MASE1